MKQSLRNIILAAAALIIILLLIFFMIPKSSVIKLSSVEIKDYNGSKLSSVNDFRENSIKGPQHINISSYHLEISGLVKNPKNYTYDEILSRQSYEKAVTLNCVEGWSVSILWQGILLKDLINESSPLNNSSTIIFYAYDGYSTSFPLDYIKQNNILLAYKMNNITIPDERGFPFMLVAESKWGYKWIKWITRIEISNNSDYKGYWESRGYSENGDLNESFF